MLVGSIITERKTEVAKPPAEQWRNRWRRRPGNGALALSLWCSTCLAPFGEPEFMTPHCAAFKSREIAEAMAQKDLEQTPIGFHCEYIGPERTA